MADKAAGAGETATADRADGAGAPGIPGRDGRRDRADGGTPLDHLRDSFKVFAPARETPDGHDRSATLLAFLGRDPRWSPRAT
ncbi:hypothetical protein [Streptomyces sp. NPDC060002]|uniref:hypothetical protein n=1 Tax=Streptomyces sp. NPDC060002 TaxID=3347033 RepID=UPI00369F37EC